MKTNAPLSIRLSDHWPVIIWSAYVRRGDLQRLARIDSHAENIPVAAEPE
jgi:hypothetical protein